MKKGAVWRPLLTSTGLFLGPVGTALIGIVRALFVAVLVDVFTGVAGLLVFVLVVLVGHVHLPFKDWYILSLVRQAQGQPGKRRRGSGFKKSPSKEGLFHSRRVIPRPGCHVR